MPIETRPTLAAAALVVTTALAVAEEPYRLKPVPPSEFTAAQKAWADEIAKPPRNADIAKPPYRAYARSPELASRLSAVSDYLRWNSSLPARLSEMAILITAREWGAEYEWYAHYPLALKGGLDPGIADAIGHAKRPAAMKPDETALYDLATELYRNRAVSDATYATALAQFGERGIMDIVAIIGYYDLVSMTLITMQAHAPDDKVPPLPKIAK